MNTKNQSKAGEIMDLKVATKKDIQDELERRRMVERDESIKDHFNQIVVDYNTGKIDHILLTRKNVRNQDGKEISTSAYVVYLKPERGVYGVEMTE
jgi:hypothetical protein